MANSNPYDTQIQARKFFLKNLGLAIWNLINRLSYALLQLSRWVGRLFLEAIGKR